jgi:hypothetical protein
LVIDPVEVIGGMPSAALLPSGVEAVVVDDVQAILALDDICHNPGLTSTRAASAAATGHRPSHFGTNPKSLDAVSGEPLCCGCRPPR